MTLLLALSVGAWSASLDNLEVGGPWGSPTATDATALWWNPAGIAADRGTRIMLDGERVAATVKFDRQDPYSGGLDIYKTDGVIPFGGVVTDLGVRGLGVGLGLAVPIGRGGTEVDPPGTGAYQMIHGATQQPNLMASVAYQPAPVFGIGVSALLINAEWEAVTLFQNVTDLDANIAQLGQESGYTDAMIEDPDYAATVTYDTLKARSVSAALGLRSQPIEALELGASWVFGRTLTHTGGVTLDFGCPPQSDTLGRFGAEAYGICDTSLRANSTLTFAIPSRLRLGAAYTLRGTLRAELMGGWTGWSVLDGFAITMSDVAALNELDKPDTAALIEQDRLWARDNQDALWFAVDTKTRVGERWTLGARLLYDQAAVPDAVLSPNNYDADTLVATGLVAVKLIDQLELGLRFAHHMSAPRTTTESAYGVTLDAQSAVDPAYFYPQMAGTYESSISRLGLTVRGRFGDPQGG